MCDKLNGKPYTRGIPAPVNYDLANYSDEFSNCSNNAELIDVKDDEMKRYAADDVIDHYNKIHNGKNPLRLRDEQMTDQEMSKFFGQTNYFKSC